MCHTLQLRLLSGFNGLSPGEQIGRVSFQVTSGLQLRDGLPVSLYPKSQLKVTEVLTAPDPSIRRWMSPELEEQSAGRQREDVHQIE